MLMPIRACSPQPVCAAFPMYCSSAVVYWCLTYHLQSGRGEQAHRRGGGPLLLMLERHRRGEVELVEHGEGVAPGVGVGENLTRTRSRDSAQPRGPLKKKLLKTNKQCIDPRIYKGTA